MKFSSKELGLLHDFNARKFETKNHKKPYKCKKIKKIVICAFFTPNQVVVYL